MDTTNVIESEECGCGGSLRVLTDVQRAYQERMDRLEAMPEKKRPQMQVALLRNWVRDLVQQNSLLSRAVEELEAEATSRLLLEHKKNSEMVCELRAEVTVLRRRLARKDSDLRALVEVLRRLRECDFCTLGGIHFFEVTESDIFGKDVENTLAQGDTTQDMTALLNKQRKNNKHARII